MKAMEEVVRITDAIHAFLEGLDTVLSTGVKPLLISMPARPELSAMTERLTAEMVRQHLPDATRFLNTSYARLTELDPGLSQQERKACLAYHRLLVQPFFFQTPFTRRAADRPLGYPGDYGVVEMIFDDQDDGATPLARLLSQYQLQQGPACAHRARLPWAHRYLWRRMETATARPFKVLSFACGPERVLREFVAQGGTCDITLCDFDKNALDFCRRAFRILARTTGTSLPIQYVELSAHSLVRDPKTVELLRHTAGDGCYDIILILGLLDYLEADAISAFLDSLVSVLKPGGDILLTNMHSKNPWRSFIEYVGDWYVIHREVGELRALAIGSPPRVIESELLADSTGTNLYFAGRRHS